MIVQPVSLQRISVITIMSGHTEEPIFPNDGRIWRAYYTKPRHEKKASERLSEDGYEIFCPLKETRVRWSDRWKRVKKPLFTGYIFARVNEHERRQILEDPSIYRTVMWLGKPALIRDEEIRVIQILLGEVKADDIEIEHVREGDHVRVESGELRNFHGVVVEVLGKRARLHIESMRCDLTFTVRLSQLEKI